MRAHRCDEREELGLSEEVTGRDVYAKSLSQNHSYPRHQCGFPPKSLV